MEEVRRSSSSATRTSTDMAHICMLFWGPSRTFTTPYTTHDAAREEGRKGRKMGER